VKQINLREFTAEQIDAWTRHGERHPDSPQPPAIELLRQLWEEQPGSGTSPMELDPGADCETISEAVQDRVIDLYGESCWNDMEEYINRMSEGPRDGLTLSDFVAVFRAILRGDGVPEE
jgi:hypothetical protein